MKANRKADLQRKLTLRVVPTPPAGLAERIKSDIPKHLPTATELDRRRLNSAVAFNMRVAASVLLLIGSLFFALHLLNRAYQQEDARMASFDEALQKNAAPARDVSPLPKQARSEPQVVTSTEQPPKVVAPPLPARPVVAKQQQEERGRVQIAEADNGPAGGEAGRRQQLRDERKDNAKDSDQKLKEETTKAGNELKGLADLDKTVPGGMTAPAAAGAKAAPVAAPSPQAAAPPPPPAESYAHSAPKPQAPVTTANGAPAVAETVTITAEERHVTAQAQAPAPAPSESRASSRKKVGTTPRTDFVGSAQAADLAIGAPSTLFGYALAGKSLEAAPLVQRFTAPESRPRHGLQVETSAAPAPLDATKKVLRISIDTALVSGELGASPAPVAADVQWDVELDPAAVVSHRAVTGEPSRSEHALVEGVSVTALYELELKPSLPRRTHVATVRLHYRSLPDGHERTLAREVYVRDIAVSWDNAPARTKRASLAAAFAEAHARGGDTTAIVEKARAMGFEALGMLR
jgi:hypothetical protein